MDVLILACLKKGRLININCILSENTNNTLMATDIVQVAATKKIALEKKQHSTTSGTLQLYFANVL